MLGKPSPSQSQINLFTPSMNEFKESPTKGRKHSTGSINNRIKFSAAKLPKGGSPKPH